MYDKTNVEVGGINIDLFLEYMSSLFVHIMPPGQ